MTEEPKENKIQETQAQDYQFINEQIVSKKKKRWKKRLESFVFVVLMAVVFGVVARYFFLISGDALADLFGIQVEPERQQVDLPRPTTPITLTPSPTPTRRATPTPAVPPITDASPAPTGSVAPEGVTPVLSPEATTGAEIKPTGGESEVPSVTEEPTVSETPEDAPLPPDGTPDPKDNHSYVMMYEEIMALADKISSQIVLIDAVEQSVDWFQEVYQTRTKTTGLVVGNDGIDLLILADYERVAEADTIEVTFTGNRVISGSLFSANRDYGLAIVAVPLAQIPEEALAEIQIAMLATEDKIRVGVPIIALGSPNGYADSMEFGMITSLGSVVPVLDGQVKYFTTNLTDYAQGHGFIINLQGEILGMMTHTYKANSDDGIASAVMLDALRGIIVKLLNQSEFTYAGIKGMDLPAELQKASGVSAGVYVKEIDAASPAINAGIKSGDILISVNQKELTGIADFTQILLESAPKDTISVTLLRMQGGGTKELTVDILLTKKAEE